MALRLSSILNAAPGLISAATEIIGMIRKNKKNNQDAVAVDATRYDELAALVEQQARVIEELALNNRNLVLAVKNNRIVAVVSIMVALCALAVAVFG